MRTIPLFVLVIVLALSHLACAGRDALSAGPTTQPSLSSPDFALMEKAGWVRSPLTGVMAPDFALLNDDLEFMRLSDQRGKWVVVYFYPSDDTPGCTCQATDFTRQLQAFADLNAVVMGVSADPPQQHQFFRKKYGLEIPLLSDSDGAVSKQYGAWAQANMGDVAYGRVVRSTFVIGPDGHIRRHWPEVQPEGHVDRVREFIEEQVTLAGAEASRH